MKCERCANFHPAKRLQGLGWCDFLEDVMAKDEWCNHWNCKHEKKYDNILLTSLPPKQRWTCTKCGEKGIDTVGKELNYE